MKSYRITVNGNVYDVTVEETTGNEAATATHPVSNAGSVEIKSSVPVVSSTVTSYTFPFTVIL